jgi:hypothetical protein
VNQLYITALLSVVTSAITGFVASKFSMRAERKKWEDQLALELSKLRVDNPKAAERIAQDFAIAFLTIVQPGEEKIKVFIPPNGSLLIGRDANADVRLKESMSSRQHMRISSHDGKVSISDLYTALGGTLNDKTIDVGAVLKDGDQIEIGDTVIYFTALPK